jgi:hypothetical protein
MSGSVLQVAFAYHEAWTGHFVFNCEPFLAAAG